ncbi:hypothetical protein BKA82DRAFT_4017214 [Pisolithus tinctorius]|nr:hypothetical protein BKA82DRAFT_4017214 [Pisolithus tinctorius]
MSVGTNIYGDYSEKMAQMDQEDGFMSWGRRGSLDGPNSLFGIVYHVIYHKAKKVAERLLRWLSEALKRLPRWLSHDGWARVNREPMHLVRPYEMLQAGWGLSPRIGVIMENGWAEVRIVIMGYKPAVGLWCSHCNMSSPSSAPEFTHGNNVMQAEPAQHQCHASHPSNTAMQAILGQMPCWHNTNAMLAVLPSTNAIQGVLAPMQCEMGQHQPRTNAMEAVLAGTDVKWTGTTPRPWKPCWHQCHVLQHIATAMGPSWKLSQHQCIPSWHHCNVFWHNTNVMEAIPAPMPYVPAHPQCHVAIMQAIVGKVQVAV